MIFKKVKDLFQKNGLDISSDSHDGNLTKTYFLDVDRYRYNTPKYVQIATIFTFYIVCSTPEILTCIQQFSTILKSSDCILPHLLDSVFFLVVYSNAILLLKGVFLGKLQFLLTDLVQ